MNNPNGISNVNLHEAMQGLGLGQSGDPRGAPFSPTVNYSTTQGQPVASHQGGHVSGGGGGGFGFGGLASPLGVPPAATQSEHALVPLHVARAQIAAELQAQQLQSTMSPLIDAAERNRAIAAANQQQQFVTGGAAPSSYSVPAFQAQAQAHIVPSTPLPASLAPQTPSTAPRGRPDQQAPPPTESNAPAAAAAADGGGGELDPIQAAINNPMDALDMQTTFFPAPPVDAPKQFITTDEKNQEKENSAARNLRDIRYEQRQEYSKLCTTSNTIMRLNAELNAKKLEIEAKQREARRYELTLKTLAVQYEEGMVVLQESYFKSGSWRSRAFEDFSALDFSKIERPSDLQRKLCLQYKSDLGNGDDVRLLLEILKKCRYAESPAFLSLREANWGNAEWIQYVGNKPEFHYKTRDDDKESRAMRAVLILDLHRNG